MSISPVLDVAIGVVFVFLLLSLICSAANELIELVLKNRASDLEKGLRELVADQSGELQPVSAIYDHAIVNGLFKGSYAQAKKTGRLPSYIPSRNFAIALLDVYGKLPAIEGGSKLAADAAGHSIKARQALDAFEKTAGADFNLLQASVEAWYNSAMDRVSGWYKRRSQVMIFIIGALLAVALNVDCVDIANRLSNDAALRQGLVAAAQATAVEQQTSEGDPAKQIQARIDELNGLGLRIGWSKETSSDVGRHWLGWLLTALATSLGAPFWFDVLNRFMVVRSTVKPSEKSKDEQSKDPR